MPTFDSHFTPNPNSIKFTTDAGPFIDQGMASYNSPDEAGDDLLGQRLLSIPGVSNLFVLPQFLTITKHPAANWDMILPKVEKILNDHFKGAAPPADH